MISNQQIIDAVQKMDEASGYELKVYTREGVLVTRDGTHKSDDFRGLQEKLSGEEAVKEGAEWLFAVLDEGALSMILSVSEEVVGRMAKLQLEILLQISRDRFDRDNFIKNLLLDNLLPVDVFNYAKKLGLGIQMPRVAFLIETKETNDVGALETVRSMFADNENDFVASIDENNIILVKELPNGEGMEELKGIAYTICDMLNTEAMSQVRVSFGNVAEDIRKVPTSYKEARLALSVGKIFSSGQTVIAYSSLGIGRLIYQLPLPMCRMFIGEIFKDSSPEEYDEETLTTINQFFDNNLNVSETSRKLYIHRNTLVYRLDKLQKNTGLDLRVFDDAITFKIALMVVKYMHYMENQE